MSEVYELNAATVMRLEPGDIVLVQLTDRELTLEETKEVFDKFTGVMPAGVKVVVFGNEIAVTLASTDVTVTADAEPAEAAEAIAS